LSPWQWRNCDDLSWHAARVAPRPGPTGGLPKRVRSKTAVNPSRGPQSIERVSTDFEPSLWIGVLEIAIWRPETGPQNSAEIAKEPNPFDREKVCDQGLFACDLADGRRSCLWARSSRCCSRRYPTWTKVPPSNRSQRVNLSPCSEREVSAAGRNER
jgi:hypothetical protein